MTAGRSLGWTGLAVFTVAAALGLTHSDIGWDGTWVLQVVSRMQAGDVLYRDVFAGVTPLAFYVTRAATALLGVEFAVLKLLVAATIAVSWWVAARLLRRLTGSPRFDWPLAVAMIAFALPETSSLYQPLANLFLLVAVDAAMVRAGGARVGAACALSFLSKQSVGLIGVAAVTALFVIRRRRADGRGHAPFADAALAAGAFVLVCAIVLAPVAFGGAWPAFKDYAFMNKTTYLREAGVAYVEEIAAFVRWMASGASGDIVRAAKSLPMLVPAVAVMALAATVALRRVSRDIAPVAVLGLAELAALYPRADVAHVIPVVPGLLVVLFFTWHLAAREGWRLVTILGRVALAAAIAGVAVRGTAAGAAIAGEAHVVSALPHLRGLVMPRAQAADLARDARRLREAGSRGPLFLLVPNAGLYYLASGLRNPTPFDYPLVTAFGRTGMADTIARIESGALPQVCMTRVNGPMAPEPIQRAVDARLTPVADADLGACTLYRRAP